MGDLLSFCTIGLRATFFGDSASLLLCSSVSLGIELVRKRSRERPFGVCSLKVCVEIASEIRVCSGL